MKRLLRLTVIGLAVIALCGGHGESVVPEQDADYGITGFLKGEEDRKEYGRHDFPALTGAGEEMSPARTASCAARVRSFQGERDGGNRQPRGGFCRGGKVVCTAHPCNFMIERLTAPVRGAVSGLLSTITLRRLRI